MISGFCGESLIGRAIRSGTLDLRVHDIREHSRDPHRSVDDAPFGGGAGMVLAPDPVFSAVESAKPLRPLYLLSPAGTRFDQAKALEMSRADGFSLLCGRYEGVDERIADHLIDDMLSVGDYVLSGGEAAALVVIEAASRLVPGVMGNELSAEDESFSSGLLEYPQYTRPAQFRGWTVPDVLLSGNHKAIAEWRQAQALARTVNFRPDLIELRGGLTDDEVRLLSVYGYPGSS